MATSAVFIPHHGKTWDLWRFLWRFHPWAGLESALGPETGGIPVQKEHWNEGYQKNSETSGLFIAFNLTTDFR